VAEAAALKRWCGRAVVEELTVEVRGSRVGRSSGAQLTDVRTSGLLFVVGRAAVRFSLVLVIGLYGCGGVTTTVDAPIDRGTIDAPGERSAEVASDVSPADAPEDRDGPSPDVMSGAGATIDAEDGGVQDLDAADAGAPDAEVSSAPDAVSASDGGDATTGAPDASDDASGGCASTDVTVGATTTVTCPATAAATAGYIATTCDFPTSLSPNNIFTGPVTLVSHLSRGFANFDINPVSDGRIQLMCFYANGDGLGIGALSRLIQASSCSATSAAAFSCTR
jgi:hypothetical protein